MPAEHVDWILLELDGWLAAAGLPWRLSDGDPFIAFLLLCFGMVFASNLLAGVWTLLARLGRRVAGRKPPPAYRFRRVSKTLLQPKQTRFDGTTVHPPRKD